MVMTVHAHFRPSTRTGLLDSGTLVILVHEVGHALLLLLLLLEGQVVELQWRQGGVGKNREMASRGCRVRFCER